MDTMQAMMMGQANRDKERRVFDWDKAARLIVEHKAQSARAGLQEDWGYTSGPILAYGRPLELGETYTYLGSKWATPVLELDGGEWIQCWIMNSERPEWGPHTFWPDSAVAILSGATQ